MERIRRLGHTLLTSLRAPFARRTGRCSYQAVSPPSITNSVPVTQADSSEARYRQP